MRLRAFLGFFAVFGLLLAIAACPVNNPGTPDGGMDADGDAIITTNPPLRDVTFNGLSPGEFAGGTINAVTFQVGPYNGNQIIQVQNQLGEGQDLILECGAVSLQAPEFHRSFQIIFNDDNATLLISVFDQNNQLLTSRPIDTRADGASLGVTRVDAVYKKLQAMIAAGSQQVIGTISIASCQGYLHEIVLQ